MQLPFFIAVFFIVEPSGILCVPPVAIFFLILLDLDFIFFSLLQHVYGGFFPEPLFALTLSQSPRAEVEPSCALSFVLAYSKDRVP
jgi:hypothetical protein